MRIITRVLRLVVFLLASALSALAQTSRGPTGHWEGRIQAPGMELPIEIDLTKNAQGQLTGTFTSPSERVKGLPLSKVTVEGQTVRMDLKSGSGGGLFDGTLSADGASMTGSFTANEGGYVIPFNLTRTGEARIAEVPKSRAVGKEFEGAWTGTLDVGGRSMRVNVTITNHADGTATGTVASPEGTGVDIPIAMTQQASRLTIDVPSVGAQFVGELNAAGSELTGTWKQGAMSLPLTFKRP